MAIAVDATGNSAITGSSSLTYAFTCASDAFLVVFVAVFSDVVSVTFNGVSMTEEVSDSQVGSAFVARIFTLAAPDSGTHDIVITAGDSTFIGSSAISFTGAVGFSATSSSKNTSNSPSLTTNTAEDVGFVVSGLVAAAPVSAPTYTGSGTEFGNQGTANKFSSDYKDFSGSSNPVATWSLSASTAWTMVGIEVYGVTPTLPSHALNINQSIKRSYSY